ncbi:MAG: sigma-70 family RNA polymerase sigma factor [Chloroflexi bacterium]|nr:sigma-70 family RNA polymerase sigma factor [Chloroflexota bacterium]
MQAEQAPPRTNEEQLAHEKALVERARDDPEAFTELYDRYVERVYQYAYRRLGTHEDAEDVTAQTFHHAIEHLERYEWRGLPFGAWLFRIAHNLVVDKHRSAQPAVSLDGIAAAGFEPEDGNAEAPDERLIGRDDARDAWDAVAALPSLQRRAVVLRFARELSHAEVGVIIGRSEAATKQLIYRAMLTLRARLGVTA